MTSTGQDFQLFAGDDLTITITVADKDISGATVTWVLYDNKGAIQITKTVGDGVTLTTPANGVFTVALDPDDTVDLPASIRGTPYWHEAEVIDSGGNVSTVTVGRVMIYKSFAEAAS